MMIRAEVSAQWRRMMQQAITRWQIKETRGFVHEIVHVLAWLEECNEKGIWRVGLCPSSQSQQWIILPEQEIFGAWTLLWTRKSDCIALNGTGGSDCTQKPSYYGGHKYSVRGMRYSSWYVPIGTHLKSCERRKGRPTLRSPFILCAGRNSGRKWRVGRTTITNAPTPDSQIPKFPNSHIAWVAFRTHSPFSIHPRRKFVMTTYDRHVPFHQCSTCRFKRCFTGLGFVRLHLQLFSRYDDRIWK